MLNVRPAFYNRFKCIAGECTDSCCIGWEVVIDGDTKACYEEMNTDFGEKIKANIAIDEEGLSCFKLDGNERCPFLNNDNLCEIILNCGEESICYICKEHPRFYNDFPLVTEYGLGLCCEEVCRLLIENDEPLEFESEEDNIDPEEFFYSESEIENERFNELAIVREAIYNILYEELSYNKKVEKIIELTEKHFNEKIVLDNDNCILVRYGETEPINKEWVEYLKELNEKIAVVSEKETPLDEKSNGDKIYSKILAYIIFRHLMCCVRADTPEFIEYLKFCLSGVRFIKLCDMKTFYEKGELTQKDRIDNIKRWSKQIEYNEDNVNMLTVK